MTTGLACWSLTAASNGTADSAVNYAEGQAPSSLNDSARALMASAAKWREDNNGTITTGGSSTSYTVVSNQGLALTAGYTVAFCPHVASGTSPVINVDSLGAKPLRPQPGIEFASGALQAGVPYIATYFTTNSGEWIVHAVQSPGMVVQRVYAATTVSASTSSASFGDSNVTATITPTKSTNQIKVTVNQTANVTSGAISCLGHLVRGSTQIGGTRTVYSGSGTQVEGTQSWCIIDSPATTNATVYKTQFNNSAATNTTAIDTGEILLEEISL